MCCGPWKPPLLSEGMNGGDDASIVVVVGVGVGVGSGGAAVDTLEVMMPAPGVEPMGLEGDGESSSPPPPGACVSPKAVLLELAFPPTFPPTVVSEDEDPAPPLRGLGPSWPRPAVSVDPRMRSKGSPRDFGGGWSRHWPETQRFHGCILEPLVAEDLERGDPSCEGRDVVATAAAAPPPPFFRVPTPPSGVGPLLRRRSSSPFVGD